MKKILYTLTAFGLIVALLSGCKMDTLPSSALRSGEAFEKPSDMEKAVLAVYDEMLSQYYYNGLMLTAGDMMGDDARASFAGSSHIDAYYGYGWTKIAAPKDSYSTIYWIIAHINDTLDRSAGMSDSSEKQAKEAELRALRAIAHFDISKLYGPLPVMLGKGKIKPDVICVPVMDKVKPIKETGEMLRQPVTAVYNFVISELEAVLSKLPAGKVQGRLGQDGVKAVLARAYLYKGDYAKAYKYANEVITSGNYMLVSRANYIASFRTIYNSESIFELDVTSDDNGGINSMGYYVLADGTTGYKELVASAHLAKDIKEDADDIRLTLQSADTPGLFVPYSDNKTKGTDYFPTNKWPGRGDNSQVNNIVVYRLSEMYLIAAECALKAGDTSRAKALVDELRSNRIRGYVAANHPTVTLDDILQERRVELFGEGHRAFDLRRNLMDNVRFTNPEEQEAYRYDKHSPLAPGVVPFDDHRNWLPFNESQLVLFPEELRDSQQTPGY